MKKFILIVAAVLTMSAVAVAQPKAIGVRAGYGAELSYQHFIGGEHFMEVDLGWFTRGFTGSVAYDFSITPSSPINFYVGPQLACALYNVEDHNSFFFGAGAQVGIEHNFSFPLNISLDWKPTFYLIPGTSFNWSSIALGLRYRF